MYPYPRRPSSGSKASSDQTEHTTASPTPPSTDAAPPVSEQPKHDPLAELEQLARDHTGETPFDARQIKTAFGFDPDDPRVTVHKCPTEHQFFDTLEDIAETIHKAGEALMDDHTTQLQDDLSDILQEVFVEAQRAAKKHEPMHSPHEGYSVIKEELDELWDEIKADRGRQASARKEAVQVAAMAVRFILDLDPS